MTTAAVTRLRMAVTMAVMRTPDDGGDGDDVTPPGRWRRCRTRSTVRISARTGQPVDGARPQMQTLYDREGVVT